MKYTNGVGGISQLPKEVSKEVMKYAKEHIVECTTDGIVETLADKVVWVETGAATWAGGPVGGGTVLAGNTLNNIRHECFTSKGIAKKVIKDTIHKVF